LLTISEKAYAYRICIAERKASRIHERDCIVQVVATFAVCTLVDLQLTTDVEIDPEGGLTKLIDEEASTTSGCSEGDRFYRDLEARSTTTA